MRLRTRLTLLTSLIVMGAAMLLGLVAYAAAASIQYQSIDRALSGAIVDVRIKGLSENPRPVPADVYNPIAIAVIDVDGRVRLLRAAGYGSEPLPFPTLSAADISGARTGPITVSSEPPHRILAAARNGRGDTIATATPLASVDEELGRLRRVIIMAIAVTTVVGATLAWLLVRRSLKPVNEMVDAAQAIAHGDSERRVPPAAAGTEMGELSEALNAMIASLTESLAEVKESEDRLRAFVSDASHEIRTPLTVIRGYSELLQQDNRSRSEVERRALARLTDETLRLEALVAQLLTLERSASTDPDAWPRIDLLAIVTAAFTDFSALHLDRDVAINGDHVTFYGDAESWRQVASNLAQNVDRYTPAGTPVAVTITESGGVVRLVVDDAGPGIPEDSRDEMLQRFTRLDDSRAKESGGAGLGLSIVRTVVEAHRGSVVLTESPLGGLRVLITVPARDQQQQQLGAPSSETHGAEA